MRKRRKRLENIKLTQDIVVLIQNLIEKFGGIDNTVMITGLSKASLNKYLNGKTDVISIKAWNDKLLPYMQPTFYNKISDRISELQEECNDWEKGFREVLDEKYTEIKKIEENSIDKENLEKIFENPILSMNERYLDIDVFKDLYNLKNAIMELKENKNYSKYKLLLHMINFRNIYEKFRPYSITNNDAYWGTVKLIEVIFEDLFCYIGIEPFFYFSKFDHTFIKNKNYSHEEINWNKMIENIETLINSVIKMIEYKAFDLLCKLKKHIPWHCEHIIVSLIKRILNGLNTEKIEFDFDKNKLLIDKTIIEISNPRTIMLDIRKISLEK